MAQMHQLDPSPRDRREMRPIVVTSPQHEPGRAPASDCLEKSRADFPKRSATKASDIPVIDDTRLRAGKNDAKLSAVARATTLCLAA
jgi:hypothetical protein